MQGVTSEDEIEASTVVEHVDAGTEMDAMGISMHALIDFIRQNTIKILGKASKTLITILVDSGSTISFLDTSVAQATECSIKDISPLRVAVANGGFVESIAICPGFKWFMQGEQYNVNLRLLELGNCDMVLGVDWLKLYSPLTFDFKELKLSFHKEGKLIELRGILRGHSKSMYNGTLILRDSEVF